jgi:hypothetical protein
VSLCRSDPFLGGRPPPAPRPELRITGTRAELSKAGALLGDVFEVLEVSEPYKNRGESQLYRLYVEATIPPARQEGTGDDR